MRETELLQELKVGYVPKLFSGNASKKNSSELDQRKHILVQTLAEQGRWEDIIAMTRVPANSGKVVIEHKFLPAKGALLIEFNLY